jgi:hypothetical protein
MKTKIIPIIVILFSTVIYARIYETYEQLVKRYGEPTIKSERLYVFEFKGLTLSIIIFDNKAVSIRYEKKKGDYASSNLELTELEREILIESNLGKGYGKMKESTTLNYVYTKGGIIASYDFIEKILTIADHKKFGEMKKNDDEKRKKEMEGF